MAIDHELEAIKIVGIEYKLGHWCIISRGIVLSYYTMQAEAEHNANALREAIQEAMRAAELPLRKELDIAATWLEQLLATGPSGYEMSDPSAPTARQLAEQLRAVVA